MRNGGTNESETVAISGGGTIGHVSAAAAIGMGARGIVVDPVPLRSNIALRLGADATVGPSAGDPVAMRQDQTVGGDDLVAECAGRPSSLANVIHYARPRRPRFVGWLHLSARSRAPTNRRRGVRLLP